MRISMPTFYLDAEDPDSSLSTEQSLQSSNYIFR